MIYEYEHLKTGERKQIVASMKNAPPLAVQFSGDEWTPAGEDDTVFWQRMWDRTGVQMGRTFPYVSRGMNSAAAAECEKVKQTVGHKYRRQVEFPVVKSAEHEKHLASTHGMIIE